MMEHVLTKKFPEHYYRMSWIQLLRPLTLSGTIAPICAGTLVVAIHQGSIYWQPFILLLLSALAVQMAANIWNDYFDFKKGQDQAKWQDEQVTNKQLSHGQLVYLALFFTCVAIILGAWLAVITTYYVIPIGMLGIFFGIYYSAGNPSLSQIGLGEAVGAIFLGFATTFLPFIVQGYYAFTEMLLISVPFALLISTMIFTNNIRDIEKDAGFRTTTAIILGRNKSIMMLRIIIITIYIFLLFLIIFEIVPAVTLLSVFAIPAAILLLHCFKTANTDPACMKYAAYHHWLFGLLFSVALLSHYLAG